MIVPVRMNYRVFLILLLVVISLVTPVLALGESHYSYINLNKMTIELINDKMSLQVDYTLDTPIKVLIVLLGKNDLKSKLTKFVNYENATLKIVEFDHAVFVIDDAVTDYGDGAFWLPEHQFSCSIPLLTIKTPQATLKYSDTHEVPKGVGYFKV